MIEVTAYAPDRETAVAFMEAVGIARLTVEKIITVPGEWTWIEQNEDGEPETVSGPELPIGVNGTWNEPYTYVAEQGGLLVPTVDVQFTTTDDGWSTGKPGWFANVRYYGATAEALMQGGNPESVDLFERAPGLLAITKARTGEPMVWVALSDDPVPPGYQNSDSVRLYDPALIATRSNVWA